MKFQSTMKKYGLDEYVAAGCQFYNDAPTGRQAFVVVWMGTQGKVCDTGCAWFEDGKCPAYRRLTIPAKIEAKQEPQETVRETAQRLGVSISEVRRRRRSATQ